MRANEADAPLSSIDLFADDNLQHPYADYRTLRQLGSVVLLEKLGVYALSRFDDVRDALRLPHRMLSGHGVGFSDAFNAARGTNVIQSDGDLHRRLRAVVTRPLTPAQLKAARPEFKRLVTARIGSLIGSGMFDAMSMLASYLPVEAVAHLVGLPEKGRERMLEWAAATFNVIGPDQSPTDLASLAQARAFMADLNINVVTKGSWAEQLFGAARDGRLSEAEALAAISAYVLPSLDTTILAMGHLLANLASSAEQWELLRAEPEHIPAAVLEGVRHSSVIRWFSRVADDDYRIGDTIIPAGARVMLMYGSANRDERHYADPDRFDVTRDARDHLAWGTGPHMCAGMHLARMEMEVLLEALVEQQVTLQAGAPEMGVNRGLYGFTKLPFRIDR